MSYKKHADFIGGDKFFKNSGAVCLFTCHGADSGFAQNLADAVNKPVIAGSDKVILFSTGENSGVTTAVGSIGGWQVFSPTYFGRLSNWLQ